MTTDSHPVTRDALTADKMTTSELAQPGRMQLLRRNRLRWLAVAATMLIVILGTTAIGGTLVHRHDDARANSHALSGIAGYSWNITTVSDKHGTARVNASWGASIAFALHGEVLADDTVNSIDGTYHPVEGGYTVGLIGASAVGYIGHDPIRIRTINAVNTLFGQSADASTATRVDAELHNGTLTLRCSGVRVTATRGGTPPGGTPPGGPAVPQPPTD